ncbi:MAG: hypothetical protein R3D58_12400 [Saprospiraceae bacterium]
MKTKLNLLVAITLICTTFLNASVTSNLNLQLKTGETPGTVTVQLDGLDQLNTQLSIQDLSGKKWFSEMIRKQTRFSKTIDLKTMPSGAYILFVKNKRSQQSRAFRLDNTQVVLFDISGDATTPGGLVLEAGGANRIIARVSATDDQTLYLHVSNLKDYQATIRIISPDGDVRWEAASRGQIAIAQTLNMKALMIEPGTYFVHIQAGDATVIQELEITGAGVQPGMAHHVSNPGYGTEMAKK